MNRRTFLASLGAAFVVACSGGGSADGLPWSSAQRDSMQALGEAARATGKIPEGRDALNAELKKHANLGSSTDSAAIAAALSEQIDADFHADAVVVVAGWVLSRTEALIAAAVTTA